VGNGARAAASVDGARGAVAWLLLVGVWLGLFHRIGSYTWGYGRSTFVWTVASVAWLLLAGHVGRLLGAVRIAPAAVVRALAIALMVLCSLRLASSLVEELRRPRSEQGTSDIALNTHSAGTAFLAGKNPYAEHAQVWHRIEPSEHVEVRGESVFMYGLPYAYGFPYFPAMFASYLPFRPLADGVDSLRIGNAMFLALNVLGILLLMRRLVPESLAWALGPLAVVSYLGIEALPAELWRFGVTDIAIATYLLYAFLALSYGRLRTAGVLFGIAQACKLLPAPLLVLPVLLWAYRKPRFYELACAYALTALALVLPYVVWDWQLFVSSTVLYYLTYHSGGDNTSLWFFLPENLRGAFSALGYAATLALVLFTLRKRDGDLLWPMALGYSAYMLFIAFARMAHLNYIWGIYPLGCVALLALVARKAERSVR
jgi:hypothetical protein